MMRQASQGWPPLRAALVGTAAVVAGASVFALHALRRARGVRGTDQYWYVSDVEMRHQTGRSITNHVLPRATHPWGSATPAAPPTWVHNVPVTYLACGVRRRITDSYRAWALTNTSLVAGSAAVVGGLLLRRLTVTDAALVAGAVLAFPLSTWFSINALSEAALVSLSALSAGTVGLLDEGHLYPGLLTATAVSAAMYLQRDNHAPQMLLCCSAALWLRRQRRLSLWQTASVGAVAGAGVAMRQAALPSMVGLSVREMLMATIGDNAVIYRRLEWSPRRFLAKIPRGLTRAVVPRTAEEAVTKTLPVVTLGAAALTLARQRRLPWLATAAAGTGGQYLLTGALIGVQPRYTASLYPLAAVAAANAWIPPRGASTRSRTRVARAVLVGVTAGFAGASIVAGQRYARGAHAEEAEVSRLRELADALPPGSILTINTDMNGIEVPYAFLPRFVITAHPAIQDAAWTRQMVGLWQISAVLDVTAHSPSPLLREILTEESVPLGAVRVRGAPGTLWSLRSQAQTSTD